MYLKTFLAILCFVVMPVPLLAIDVPALAGRVNDRAGLLSSSTAEALEQQLSGFERDQSTQIVVLTIPSLEGDDIDQFAIRVAEHWKIGQKNKDNGVIMILARKERKVRIEVGMGLQGVLPDITASHIIRDVMRPHLKSGDFDKGISAGVEAIMAATKGEFSTPKEGSAAKPAMQSKGASFPMLLILAVVAALITATFSRYLAGLAGAAGAPLIGWLAFPGTGIVTLALLAAVGLVAGLLLGFFVAALLGRGGGGGYYGGGWGGWWGGGYSGGSSSGDSSGGDDFSGGGGDFDGGGSSDDF